jgi:hypothetical protein
LKALALSAPPRRFLRRATHRVDHVRHLSPSGLQRVHLHVHACCRYCWSLRDCYSRCSLRSLSERWSRCRLRLLVRIRSH